MATPDAPKPAASADAYRSFVRRRALGATALHSLLPLALLGASLYAFVAYPPQEDFPYPLFTLAVAMAIVALVRVVRRHAAVPLGWQMGRRAALGTAMAACTLLLAFAGLYGWAAWRVSRNVEVVHAAAGDYAGDASQTLFDATVAMEDGKFYQHQGFDWEAMHRALRVNYRAGRVRQGGSTITQQLAKNLFLVKDRTVGRKLLEFPLTMELERRLTKAQILSLYVRSIDYGMNQHGITNAARFYFGTTPNKLTLSQSALLVSIVPHDPKTLPPDATLDAWRDRALNRIGGHFDEKYSEAAVSAAGEIPIGQLLRRKR